MKRVLSIFFLLALANFTLVSAALYPGWMNGRIYNNTKSTIEVEVHYTLDCNKITVYTDRKNCYASYAFVRVFTVDAGKSELFNTDNFRTQTEQTCTVPTSNLDQFCKSNDVNKCNYVNSITVRIPNAVDDTKAPKYVVSSSYAPVTITLDDLKTANNYSVKITSQEGLVVQQK